ncbi:MAG TPA: (2Fe-2S)-binding protein [Rhodocyclaceae bacterium]|nr:(2Fe-2S)-binding protein [Rhodocyclaceae bacterium]HNH34544.1 (2Fe-2S)-binding protein [Rhodocyclaceae bacterium]
MYVCVCHAVTERHVNEAISDGCRSVRELGDRLGVGRTCGRCCTCAYDIIREASQVYSSASNAASPSIG